MKKIKHGVWSAVFLASLAGGFAPLSLAQEAAATPPQNDVLALSAGSLWRKQYVFFPPQLSEKACEALKIDPKDAKARSAPLAKHFLAVTTPLPDPDWIKPEFNDRPWWHAAGVDLTAEEVRVAYSGDAYSRGSDRFCPAVGMVAMRGKFLVTDCAKVKKLTLNITYRGGFVAYLNGQEVARVGMPEGKIEPMTAATTEYPDEAFGIKTPDGKFTPHHWYNHPADKFMAEWMRRETKAGPLEINPKALKNGVNVFALELHRSYLPALCKTLGITFTPVGLGELFLHAETPAENIRSSIQDTTESFAVANADIYEPVTTGYLPDPAEKLAALQIPAVRGGEFSAKVVVSSPAEIEELAATVGALAGPGDIPPAAVQVRYALVNPARANPEMLRQDGLNAPRFDMLLEKPPAKIALNSFGPQQINQGIRKSLGLPLVPRPRAVLPLWVTVKTPKDAKAGLYKGAIKLSAKGVAPITLPIELQLADWTLPEVKDETSCLSLYQSPETLAVSYNVAPWSDAHWRHVEQALKICGELGNTSLFLMLTAQTSHGNPYSWVQWIKQPDGSYKHDFSIVDRYLELAMKYHDAGRMKAVCLRMYGPEVFPKQTAACRVCWGDGGTMATEVDPATGKKTNFRVPQSGEWVKGGVTDKENSAQDRAGPKLVEFWKPVVAGIKQRLEKYKLDSKMAVSEVNDYGPSANYGAAIEEIQPGIGWFKTSHMASKTFMRDPNDKTKTALVRLTTAVWGGDIPDPAAQRLYGWKWIEKPNDTVIVNFNRAGCNNLCMRSNSVPWLFHMLMEADIANGRNGAGNIGVDYFGIDFKQMRKLFGDPCPETKWGQDIAGCMYSCFPTSTQVNTGITDNIADMLAPGPETVALTERSENLRMGIFETEARTLIERALVAKTLPAELAAKCQAVLDARTTALRLQGVLDYYNFSNVPWSFKFRVDWAANTAELFQCAAEVAQAAKK